MRGSVKQITVVQPYREESVKVPAAVTLAVLLLVAVPLVMWIMKINNEGSRSANVVRFNNLITEVSADVRAVRALLNNDAEELEAMRQAREAAVVTLIVPELVIVEEQGPNRPKERFDVSLDGIYWSAKNPLASINGQTCRVGDIIQGHEIVYIGKTTVRFQARDGSLVVKGIYDELLKGQRDNR